MSGTTSVPFPAFDTLGFRVPVESLILQGVFADLQSCFGGGLNPNLETPQGQLATTATAIIADNNDQFLLLTQNMDPAYSSGRMQDGIARIYFLTRYPARATVVSATCTGLPGVVIPAGVAQAIATDGNYYTAIASGTISGDGTCIVPFQCTANGPIACPAGTLNQVAVVISGWDSIVNLNDGELGQNVESRAQFEQRRYASVAANSMGMLASVQGAVLNVANVLDAYTTENFTGVPVTQDGVLLPAHSLYVCVYGGAANDVGHAIFTKKAPGCAMAGNTTVYVADTNSGLNPPPPNYQITFQTAIPQKFVMTVTLINSTAVPSTVLTDVQNAVVNAWNGLDGGTRARIGSIVFASRYYGPVSLLGSWVQLVSIKLGSDVAPAASFTGSIAAGASLLTVATVTAGALAAGQTVIGCGQDGVQIASQASGPAGGAGTYNLNAPVINAVGAPTPVVMSGVLPSLDDVSVGIAHVPIIGAGNIRVVLQ